MSFFVMGRGGIHGVLVMHAGMHAHVNQNKHITQAGKFIWPLHHQVYSVEYVYLRSWIGAPFG